MVIPTIAYPARVTIPDQQALICFTNGIERLVIETRFTGAGTNFAWVVPLPSQPVIEEATTGLFPTLQFILRPEIIHEVPRYFASILALMGIGSLLLFVRPTGQIKLLDVLACICVGVAAASSSDREAFSYGALCFFAALLFCDVVLIRVAQRSAFAVFGFTFLGAFCLCGLLLPAGAHLSKGIIPAVSAENISILERKIVGVFETTTIASRDAKALQAWLSENGYSIPTNSEAVISSYAKSDWVFVATKIRRANAASDASTPHPLSFTFKTDKPVYPMRLTGLASQSLKVDLFVFGNTSATAPHFRVDSSTHRELSHPLLRQWFGGSAVVTKLTANLSPADMSEDVWVNLSPAYHEQKNHFYSRHGAVITALNWGAGVVAIGLLCVCGLVLASPTWRGKLSWLICIVALAGVGLAGQVYEALPKIDVRLVRGGLFHDYNYTREEMLVLRMALDDLEWHTAAQARSALQKITANSTNAANYGVYGVQNWDNHLLGGQFHEEDSPGNYLLRETNNQLELVLINAQGGEDTGWTFDRPLQH